MLLTALRPGFTRIPTHEIKVSSRSRCLVDQVRRLDDRTFLVAGKLISPATHGLGTYSYGTSFYVARVSFPDPIASLEEAVNPLKWKTWEEVNPELLR